jgi:hypothetical protein
LQRPIETAGLSLRNKGFTEQGEILASAAPTAPTPKAFGRNPRKRDRKSKKEQERSAQPPKGG